MATQQGRSIWQMKHRKEAFENTCGASHDPRYVELTTSVVMYLTMSARKPQRHDVCKYAPCQMLRVNGCSKLHCTAMPKISKYSIDQASPNIRLILQHKCKRMAPSGQSITTVESQRIHRWCIVVHRQCAIARFARMNYLNLRHSPRIGHIMLWSHSLNLYSHSHPKIGLMMSS